MSVVVALSGGFRVRLGAWRIAVTSPYPLLLWAFAIGIIRHFMAPATPVYRDLPERLAASWRHPGVHTAAIVVAGTGPCPSSHRPTLEYVSLAQLRTMAG